MVFIKGIKKTTEDLEKAKLARYKKNGNAVCPSCGDIFPLYSKKILTCGKKECILKRYRLRYDKMKEENPMKSMAFRLFSSIRLGKSKLIISERMLRDAIGKPCPYCQLEITNTNASVDHKTPRTGSKVFNRQKRTMTYSYKQITELDKEENLHIVCRECNQLKGDMEHGQFIRLMEWFKTNKDIEIIIRKRLGFNKILFSKWQKHL